MHYSVAHPVLAKISYDHIMCAIILKTKMNVYNLGEIKYMFFKTIICFYNSSYLCAEFGLVWLLGTSNRQP